MVDYRGDVRTRNNSKAEIFGLNLDTVTELKLNDKSIYDSEVCAFLNEFNPDLNMYTFSISLNG